LNPNLAKPYPERKRRVIKKTFPKIVDKARESEYSSKCAVESGSD